MITIQRNFTVAEVSDLMRRPPKVVKDLIKTGLLSSITIGGVVLIPPAAYEQFIKQGTTPPVDLLKAKEAA